MNAPVISATPKKCSAQNDNNKQKTNDKTTNRLRSILYRFMLCSIALETKNPATPPTIKNNTILINTSPILTSVLVALVTTVKAMTPKISSMMAAPKIALPARVFSFPSSFNVSTVILTDVAVRIIPIKIFCNSGAAAAS